MLAVKDVNLVYSYKHVLKDVSASFESGKVHLVLGENGAGKSTLAKILCGDLKPTSGKILIDDKEVVFKNPNDALSKGIGCVHQRPLLADTISIRDNLILGNKNIDLKHMEILLKDFIPNRSPKELAKNLTAYERLAVALVGIILKKPSVIILDEPSALLTFAEREFIADKMKEFAKRGGTAIVVSHYLRAAYDRSDKLLLLKNGSVLLQEKKENITYEDLCKQLFEKVTTSEFDISWPEDLKIFFMKEKIDERNFVRYTAAGKRIGFVPSDRTFVGSNPNLTILQLLTIYHTDYSQKRLVEYAQKIIAKADVDIKVTEKAASLSGGMLQRLLLQREIAEKPAILYLCEPRQGLDINAIEYLFSVVRELLQQGVKVIVQEAAS